jgi:aspartyl-tRNA(Asn)/glutamyl-tRNA(Gln) amidotransferase subunit A
MQQLSLKQLSEQLQTKKISSQELTEYFLKRIYQQKHINSFIHINEEESYKQAHAADLLLSNGQAKPLTGIPIAHKDIFCTRIWPSTAASKILENYVSPFDATVVDLFNQQGTVTLGKTNMDEFGMGSSNENSYFGPVKNPWDQERSSGGSSGGSAAAIAAGLAPLATGTDTGGSIRQPAAFSGISGIKPTYGLVSRYGMIAFASSLDQAGPMAKSVEDLAFALEVMVQHDPKDSTSIKREKINYLSCLNDSLRNLKIGLPKCFFSEGIDTNIQKAIMEAVDFYEKAGAKIIDIDLKTEPLWVPCYYVIVCAEASSNLSRYDGIRYGFRAKDIKNIKELIQKSRTEGFGDEVKRRILTGTHVLSAGYFDAYYLQALKIRRLIQNEFLEIFKKVDVILGPTTPNIAFKLNTQKNPVSCYLQDRFTVAVNLAGLPAVSIPVGKHQNMPIGMQLIAGHFSEAKLLNIAHHFQLNSDWHLKQPLNHR